MYGVMIIVYCRAIGNRYRVERTMGRKMESMNQDLNMMDFEGHYYWRIRKEDRGLGRRYISLWTVYIFVQVLYWVNCDVVWGGNNVR